MDAARYCFDQIPVHGIAGLWEHMTGSALRSPYRSTVPLLSLVYGDPASWRALLASLGTSADSTVHFEYRVASPKAGGNPSQTDAMIISGSTVWAIEAKWTEPRYETVGQWIRKRTSHNAAASDADYESDRRTTVNGWIDHLRPFSLNVLTVDDFLGVVYQVLHRTASACAVAKETGSKPHLVYLHFHPSPLRNSATTDQYFADLQTLHGLLGNTSAIGLSVVEMDAIPNPAFKEISGLDKRGAESAKQVIMALCKGPLFTFGVPIIRHLH